jgi:hypothetical protein
MLEKILLVEAGEIKSLKVNIRVVEPWAYGASCTS